MLTTTNVKDVYAGTGARTLFPITFQFQENTQIYVYSKNTTTLVETVLTVGANYTVNGGNPGNEIQLSVALATGNDLYIYRVTPVIQDDFDAINNSSFLAEDLESAIDKNVMILQELEAAVDGTVLAEASAAAALVSQTAAAASAASALSSKNAASASEIAAAASAVAAAAVVGGLSGAYSSGADLNVTDAKGAVQIKNTQSTDANNVVEYSNRSAIKVGAVRGNGAMGIGTINPDSSAQLDVSSTTKGLLPPRMTTAQRNAIGAASGLHVYDTDLQTPLFYGNSSWQIYATSKAPTVTKYTAGSGTYNLPTGARFLRIVMVGGGGGGAGSSNSSNNGGAGGNGVNTTFGLHTSGGGFGATGGSAGTPGAGGGVSIGTGGVGTSLIGMRGGAPCLTTATNTAGSGSGGLTPYFTGGGASTQTGAAGYAGTANTGGGGAGGGGIASTVSSTGAGGGSGGFLDIWIAAPVSSYSYAVGTGGTSGAAGTSGFSGGAGADGQIIVEAYY